MVSSKLSRNTSLIVTESVDCSRINSFEFDKRGVSVALFENERIAHHVELLMLVIDYVGTELVLRYSSLVKLVFVNFQSVLERLQKTKVLFRQYKLFYRCSEKLLF